MTSAACPCHGHQGAGDTGLMKRHIGNEFAPPKCSDDSETNSSGGKLNDWTKWWARLWHCRKVSQLGIKRRESWMILTCSRSLSSSAFSTRVSASFCSSDCLGSGRRWAWSGSSGRKSSPLSGTGSAAWGRSRGLGLRSWWACLPRWCSQSLSWGWPKEHDCWEKEIN